MASSLKTEIIEAMSTRIFSITYQEVKTLATQPSCALVTDQLNNFPV